MLLRTRREACVVMELGRHWWLRCKTEDARAFMAVRVSRNAHLIFVRGGRLHQKGERALRTRPYLGVLEGAISVPWLRHPKRREQVVTS